MTESRFARQQRPIRIAVQTDLQHADYGDNRTGLDMRKLASGHE
jgi:hypothetical protein